MLKLLIKYGTMRETLRRFIHNHLVAEIHVNYFYCDEKKYVGWVMINDRTYFFDSPSKAAAFNKYWNQNKKT